MSTAEEIEQRRYSILGGSQWLQETLNRWATALTEQAMKPSIFQGRWKPFHEPRPITPGEPRFRERFEQVLAECGKTKPKQKPWAWYIRYAINRGKSSHSHNTAWRPVYEAWVAIQIAVALESKQ